jgi:hypothetical protein
MTKSASLRRERKRDPSKRQAKHAMTRPTGEMLGSKSREMVIAVSGAEDWGDGGTSSDSGASVRTAGLSGECWTEVGALAEKRGRREYLQKLYLDENSGIESRSEGSGTAYRVRKGLRWLSP